MSSPSMKHESPALVQSGLVFHTRRKLARVELASFLAEVERRVLRGRSCSCLITNDEELRGLNKQYRRKDYAADVLSFPSGGPERFAGDLAISIDRAREQASEYGHSPDVELKILILHGALHLAGMDHEKDAGEMARAEARWRKRFELPVGLIERAGTFSK